MEEESDENNEDNEDAENKRKDIWSGAGSLDYISAGILQVTIIYYYDAQNDICTTKNH